MPCNMRSKSYAEKMRLINRLTKPAIRQAIQAMQIPIGSMGLDAGCGNGQRTLWLAEASGTGGKVVGVDICEDNLHKATYSASQSPHRVCVDFVRSDLFHLPFEDGSFDWAWCADTLWPLTGRNVLAGVEELARVVKPGGRVGLLFWSSQTLLPGHPMLEARLNLAHVAHNPYLCGIKPQLQFLNALGWLRKAGLEQIAASTFVADAYAPLDRMIQDAIAYCFIMFWDDLKAYVSEDDFSMYRRLCDPKSKECVLYRSDYYCLLTYTLFHGKVAKS
jgi:ubiquinone/menaquinone biosynthesis C-methylase UbiE